MHVLTEVFLQLFVRAQDLSILEGVREIEAHRSAAVEIDGVRRDWDYDCRRRKTHRGGGGLRNGRKDGL